MDLLCLEWMCRPQIFNYELTSNEVLGRVYNHQYFDAFEGV